jgi:hypothetical protein
VHGKTLERERRKLRFLNPTSRERRKIKQVTEKND